MQTPLAYDPPMCFPTGVCGPESDSVAAVAGYLADEIAALPEGADMGLSCGNPHALAALRPSRLMRQSLHDRTLPKHLPFP